MAYNQQTWVDNTTPLSAARLNNMEAGIAAVQEAVGQSWIAEYVQTAAQTGLATGVTTAVGYDTARISASFVTKQAGNYFTINNTGIYQLSANIRVVQSVSCETHFSIDNGTGPSADGGILVAANFPGGAGGRPTLNVAKAGHRFNAGDNFYIGLWQNSGANVSTEIGTMSASGGGWCSFTIVRIR